MKLQIRGYLLGTAPDIPATRIMQGSPAIWAVRNSCLSLKWLRFGYVAFPCNCDNLKMTDYVVTIRCQSG